MTRYDYVLLDADHTLYDFNTAERRALTGLLHEFGYPSGEDAVSLYHSINRDFWSRLDRGEITREFLMVNRFTAFLQAIGRTGDPAALNARYLALLGQGSDLLDGAEELCRALARRCTLAIVTNGSLQAQRARFDGSPLKEVIPWLFISEEVGANKPDPVFFQRVFQRMGITDLSRVLMVGDNLFTDILGGNQAGVDTAWYNPSRRPGDERVTPTYEVADYAALLKLIAG